MCANTSCACFSTWKSDQWIDNASWLLPVFNPMQMLLQHPETCVSCHAQNLTPDHDPMAHADCHAKCINSISHAKPLVPQVRSCLWASFCKSAWWLDLCRKTAPEDWCLFCLTGLTCLALAATKLAGSLTIPRGAGAGPVCAHRLPGLPCAAARPGWGPSQGLLLSMSIKSPEWGCPGWGWGSPPGGPLA